MEEPVAGGIIAVMASDTRIHSFLVTLRTLVVTSRSPMDLSLNLEAAVQIFAAFCLPIIWSSAGGTVLFKNLYLYFGGFC